MPSTIDAWTGSSSQLNTPRGQFASPWTDLASQYAPKTFKDALTLCEHLYVNNSVYKKASERIVSYFLTSVKLSGQGENEIEKFKGTLEKKFGIMERLKEMGEDYMCYGNAFASIIPSFVRMLKCTNCKDTVVNILHTNFEFRIGDLSFYSRCNKCRKTCRHMVHDYPDPNPENIKLVRWDPKRITIEHNPLRSMNNYWMDIDPWIASKIRMGDKFLLATTPWSFIQAVSRNQKYKFHPEYFFHLREGCISGINLYGWGLPSILSAFKDFFRIQVLRRYDEVLMMDYIVPMRIISPAGGGGSADGNSMMAIANMNSFRENMEGAIMRHRIDGADWNIFPFPVEYQPVGGEGLKMSPTEKITEEEDRLLNARGIPPQLYRGDLLLQTAPTALRVFERSWTSLVDGLNNAGQWMVTSLARQIKSGDIKAELTSVTLSDDLEAKNVRLQLMQAQLISKETGLAPMDIDVKNERKRLLEEQKADQREQMKAQQELEMEQMNLDTPEGDAQGTNDAGGATPMDIQGQGTALAQQLLDPQVPEQARRQQLTQLRQSNPTLHAVVIKEMDRLRGAAGTAGAAAAMPQVIAQDQAAQQAAAPVPTPGAAQSQQMAKAANLVTPNLKDNDTLVDSAVDFSKVAGEFPTEIHLTRADEFYLIKRGAQKLGISIDQYGDVLRTGSLEVAVKEILGMKLHFNAKETSFK
jgi:hypothetical protein